jgi:hypothetical protein
MSFRPPGQCPVCGEWVPRGALACDGCGACNRSGWREDPADGLDLPDEDFDYEDFVAREFGDGNQGRPPHLQPWRWVGLAVFLALVLGYLLAALR